MLVDNDLAVPLRVPAGPTTLSFTMRVALEPWDDGELDAYLAAVTSRPSIVGKSGGSPTWLQNDETPACSCGQSMRFVAQIDSAASEDINFVAVLSTIFFAVLSSRDHTAAFTASIVTIATVLVVSGLLCLALPHANAVKRADPT